MIIYRVFQYQPIMNCTTAMNQQEWGYYLHREDAEKIRNHVSEMFGCGSGTSMTTVDIIEIEVHEKLQENKK